MQTQTLQRVRNIVAVLALELDPAVEGLHMLVQRALGRGLEQGLPIYSNNK